MPLRRMMVRKRTERKRTEYKPAAGSQAEKWLREGKERLRKQQAGEPFNDGYPEDGEILGRHGGMTPDERAKFLFELHGRELARELKKEQRKKDQLRLKALSDVDDDNES